MKKSEINFRIKRKKLAFEIMDDFYLCMDKITKGNARFSLDSRGDGIRDIRLNIHCSSYTLEDFEVHAISNICSDYPVELIKAETTSYNRWSHDLVFRMK